jgi:NADH dehydrogenase
MNIFINILDVLIVLIPILMAVAFVTIAERKVMASMQRRCGPNAVGVWGLLQPFADALKLLVKEIIIPRQSNSLLFIIGPCITLVFAILGWSIIPFGEGLAIFDYELGVFFALAVSSIGSYGILISGWAANSKYAFMGAIRSTAQLLSYELVFSSIILILILFSGSFSLTYIVECQQAVWNIFPLMPIALAFFIAILAETNRPPFDLPEAEFGHKNWFNLYFFISIYYIKFTIYWNPFLLLIKEISRKVIRKTFPFLPFPYGVPQRLYVNINGILLYVYAYIIVFIYMIKSYLFTNNNYYYFYCVNTFLDWNSILFSKNKNSLNLYRIYVSLDKVGTLRK